MSVLKSFIFRSLQFRIPYTINLASYSTHRIKYEEVQDKWKEKDGVSNRWNLIYRNPMDTALSYITTYVTFSTGAMTCCGVYYGLTYDSTQLNGPILLGKDVFIANTFTEGMIYVGAFIALHIALKTLISKFVIRIYQDGDNYIAIFKGPMFNSIKQHKFHLKDFKRLNPTLVVSWGDARFTVGDRHAIILENYFKTPEHFNYLLYKKKAHNELD